MIKDGPVLFYCKDGVIYPVALDEEQQMVFELTCHLFNPIKLINKPQGQAVNLLEKKS